MYHTPIPECDEEEALGYCEGCEKADAVLVDEFHEYCEPCLEERRLRRPHHSTGRRRVEGRMNNLKEELLPTILFVFIVLVGYAIVAGLDPYTYTLHPR